MRNSKIFLGFVLALLMAIMQSAFFPGMHLFAFAPFLALLCIYVSFCPALWIAALTGTCSDFLVSDPAGIYALHYTLLCAIFFRWRLYFKEHPLQLPLFSALISFFALPLEVAILFIFSQGVERVPLFDLFMGPLIDGAYAFFWFVGPLALLEWAGNQWKLWKMKHQLDH